MTRLADALDPARDLLLGSSCLGCRRPGRLVCAGCRSDLAELDPAPAWPTPPPPGLVAPWAAAPYGGLVRALVLGLKEHRLLALVAPQADLLAGAVAALVGAGGRPSGVVLVPVPSRRRTVRARGHDATGAVARVAAARLRAEGVPARAAPLLRLRTGVVDQAGLDASARHANLAGSMTCPSPALSRLVRDLGVGGVQAGARAGARPGERAGDRAGGPAMGSSGGVAVVVCDDVLTTGATMVEAQRALRAVGLPVLGGAAVAATRRRSIDTSGPAPPRGAAKFGQRLLCSGGDR